MTLEHGDEQFTEQPRQTGLWVKTVRGWYSSNAQPRSADDLLNATGLTIFDRKNHEDYIPIDQVEAAKYVSQWCKYRGLDWELRSLRKSEDASRLAFTREQDILRYPVSLTDPSIHAYIGHDPEHPKTFDHYQKLAQKIPHANAYHPREYMMFRLDAVVPVVDISKYRMIIEWSYNRE